MTQSDVPSTDQLGLPQISKYSFSGELFDFFQRILSPLPGKNTARKAVDMFVAHLDRPSRAVMAAGAFNETAVDDDRLVFVIAQHPDKIVLALSVGLPGIP